MRSKEVEKAINDLMFIVVTDIYDNEVSIDKTKVINEYNQSVGTVLDYIKELEKDVKDAMDGYQDLGKEVCFNFISKDKIREYLEKRINDVKKAYDDLTEPYYIEGVGFNISYMTKKEKEEFINKRNCLIVQKQTYKEILDKVEELI